MTRQQKNIRACLLRLAEERGAKKTFCPSEVARLLGGAGWREWMDVIRIEASGLAAEGKLRATQRGRVVELDRVSGPIRLSQPR